jgi:TPR repeat protein
MYNLGICYEYGQGVTKDLNKAREWYTKAVAQGSAGAQTQLGSLNAANN